MMNQQPLRYEQHEVAALLPPLSGERFAKLKADIKQNGQQRAIQLQGGRVVDGWHRYRACIDLGIEPNVIEYLGDPFKLVGGDALRRDLNASQRTLFFRKLNRLRIEREAAAARDRKRAGQESGGRGHKKLSRPGTGKNANGASAILAKEAHVSPRTMERGAFVEEHATPQEIAAIEKGEASLKAVDRQIRERNGTTKPMPIPAVCPRCGRPWPGSRPIG